MEFNFRSVLLVLVQVKRKYTNIVYLIFNTIYVCLYVCLMMIKQVLGVQIINNRKVINSIGGRRGRDRIVLGFATIYAIIAYHH